jgi:hypothetical protein
VFLFAIRLSLRAATLFLILACEKFKGTYMVNTATFFGFLSMEDFLLRPTTSSWAIMSIVASNL